MQAEVVVVGAGVAGCATALHLAAHGREVLLIDRGQYPREKVCGEGLMPHGVRELRALGLAEGLRTGGARPFRGICYHVDDTMAEGRFARGSGLGVRRHLLDANLARRCAEAGVRTWLDTRVRGLSLGARGVRLDCDRGQVWAQVVVGADGRRSRVRRALGLDRSPRGPHRYGLRAHMKLAPGGRERSVVDVYLHPEVEVYLTPTGHGEVNIAVLCGKDFTRSLGQQPLDRLLAMARLDEGLADLLEGASPLTPVQVCGPLRRCARDVVADRALLVGDAAGFVDAITGEGMSIALICARLAADVLHARLDADALSAGQLQPYAAQRRAHTRDQTALTEIILWGMRHRWLARHVVRNLGRHPDLFGRLLAVNSGEAGLLDVGARGLARVLVGR